MKQPEAAANGKAPIRAIVGHVRGTGDKRFAVAYLERGTTLPGLEAGESITFSLTDWRGDTEPRKEQIVLLDGVQLFAKGWRATTARPIVLEPQARSEDQA